MIDDLYSDAVKLVRQAGNASTSTLQRLLGISYGQAVYLIDLMEARGVVGAADGPAPRKVLPTPPPSGQGDLFS